jgi:hypothetical protein
LETAAGVAAAGAAAGVAGVVAAVAGAIVTGGKNIAKPIAESKKC